MTAVQDRPATARQEAAATPRRRTRRRRLVIGAVAAAVALLALSQLVLPALAEQRVRSKLDDMGTVSQVSISAFPAVKMLWGHPDHATIRMEQLAAGPFVLRDVRVTEHGRNIDATATVPRAELPGLPAGLNLQSASVPGSRLLLDAAAGALKVHGDKLELQNVDAKAGPQGLVLHATGTLG
jgi:hypothetical protein